MKEIRSNEEMQKEVLQKKGYVILEVWASWCRPCRLMKPVLKEAESEMPGGVSLCQVEAGMDIEEIKRFHIEGYPTFLVFKNGIQIGNIVGYHTKSRLMEKIRFFVKEETEIPEKEWIPLQ